MLIKWAALLHLLLVVKVVFKWAPRRSVLTEVHFDMRLWLGSDMKSSPMKLTQLLKKEHHWWWQKYSLFSQKLSEEIVYYPENRVCFHQWRPWIIKMIMFFSLSWLLGSSELNRQPVSSKFTCPLSNTLYTITVVTWLSCSFSSLGFSVYLFH